MLPVHIKRLLACWLFALPAASVGAQLEGTLFTEPDEREYLDYLRQEFLRNNAEAGFDIEEADIPEIPEGEPVVESGPVEFSFEGVMTRRDGSRNVWLNGRTLNEAELPAGMSLVAEGSIVSLRIAQNGNIFVLHPGQTVNLTTGTVVENFQRQSQPSPPPAEEAVPANPPNASSEAAAPEAPESETSSDVAVTQEDPATEAAADPLRARDMDRAVMQMSEEEARELAAALARRQNAAAAQEPESDEP